MKLVNSPRIYRVDKCNLINVSSYKSLLLYLVNIKMKIPMQGMR